MPVTKLNIKHVPSWEEEVWKLPHQAISDVAIDSQDRVYLLARGPERVLVYSREGKFLSTWGEGQFGANHGITIGPDDSVYVVDNGQHVVRKFTNDGKLLMTIGTLGVASDTGYNPRAEGIRINPVETVERGAGPFNRCTNCAIAPNGDIYVADGYGNCRVHQFTQDGVLVKSWGEVGVGRGGFHLPHGIAIDRNGRVLVCDRQNDLVQIFDLDGKYITEWTDTYRATQIAIDRDGLVYVSELTRETGDASFRTGIVPEEQPGRVSVFDENGTLLARFGASDALGERVMERAAPGNFIAPHGIAVDSLGDVYVAEVTSARGIPAGLPPPGERHQIQKFTHRVDE